MERKRCEEIGGIVNEKLKNVVRILATCEHPLQSIAQFICEPNVVQWCTVCGAAKLLDGGALPQWCKSECARASNMVLVEEALKGPENEAAKKAISAMEDP